MSEEISNTKDRIYINGNLKWIVGLLLAVVVSVFGTYFTMSQTAQAQEVTLENRLTSVETHLTNTDLHKTDELRRAFVVNIVDDKLSPLNSRLMELQAESKEHTQTLSVINQKLAVLLAQRGETP